MRKTSRRNGFTLIEMLIVVGIIVVLAAVVITGLAKARDHARAAVCTNNEKRLWEACVAFAADNDKLLPCPTLSNEGRSTGKYVAIAMRSSGVIEDEPQGMTGTLWKYLANQPNTLSCPNDSERGNRNFSYSFNATIRPAAYATLVTYDTLRLSDIKMPGQRVLIYEEVNPDDLCFRGPTSADKISGRHGGGDSATPSQTAYSTRGKSNQLFLDGHIETVSVADFYNGAGEASYKINP